MTRSTEHHGARDPRIDRFGHERVADAELIYDALKGDDQERPERALEGVDRYHRVRSATKDLPKE